MPRFAFLCLTLFALSACAVAPLPAHAADPTGHDATYKVFHTDRDAAADIDAALTRAQASGKRALLVFGANWCHDSRGFAEHLQRPAIAELVEQHFEVALVDVGSPQTGAGNNLDLAARYGQPDVIGTPTLIVVEADGTRVNSSDDATAWRNAYSRSPEQVLADLTAYVP